MYSNGRLVGHPLLAAAGCAAGALGTAARAAAWQLADDQVQDAIALTLVAESRLAALRATLVAEANVRGLRERTQSTTTERWLADRYRLSTGDARTRVEQSHLFVRHPRLTGALADGAVTVEQATVIAQTLDEVAVLPLVEPDERDEAAVFLVEQAATLVPRDLARAGQQIVEALTRTPSVDDPAEEDALAREQRRAEEEAEAARRDLASWRHRIRPGRPGRGTLDTGPVGDALITAWEHVAGRKHPGTDGFEDDRTRDQRLGHAMLDMIADYLGQPRPNHGRESTQQHTDEPDHTDQPDEHDDSRDLDLTTPLFDQPLFDDPDGLLFDEPDEPTDTEACTCPSTGGPTRRAGVSTRALLAVTVTLTELQAALAGNAGAGGGMLDTGVALTAAELRLLACDAGIVPAVLGSPSQVLDLGRATRNWNIAQRRALAIRDRGCVAPGCDYPPSACDGHHSVLTWAQGGPTDIDNGALLCDLHHHQVHRQHWRVTLAANGYPALIPPRTIDPQQRPRQHHRFRLQLLTGRQRT